VEKEKCGKKRKELLFNKEIIFQRKASIDWGKGGVTLYLGKGTEADFPGKGDSETDSIWTKSESLERRLYMKKKKKKKSLGEEGLLGGGSL